MRIGLLPVFNEEKSILGILDKVRLRVDFIIIVNDGSSDKTHEFVSSWVADKRNVQYILLEKNRGMSYALLQGFRFVAAQHKSGVFSPEDIVVTLDGDGQHDPDEICGMQEYFAKNNLDVLIARREFLNYPKCRIFGNALLSMAASCLGRFRFRDIECGFKMLKVRFIAEMLNYYVGFRYSCAEEIGLAACLLGYTIKNDYPIKVAYCRRGGPSLADAFVNLWFSVYITARILNKKRHKGIRSRSKHDVLA